MAKIRKSSAAAAAIAVSVSAVFGGTAIGNADPYDDDDGGSSYSDDGGGSDESDTSADEPDDSGADEPDEPAGGGMEEPEPAGGGMSTDEPGGGGMAGEEPGGGMSTDEPGGGGMAGSDPTPAGGGMSTEEPGGGGMAGSDPTPAGGGMSTGEPGGGGMSTGEPGGGGMAESTQSQASRDDVSTAKSSEVKTATSSLASSEQVSSYRQSISSTLNRPALSSGLSLSSPVTRWNSGWLSYDPYYRPILTNPYRSPLDVLYDYGGQTQVITIPPLQRAAVDVPNAGVYSFTSMTRPASGPPANLSVGSFSGGGRQPAPGQPAPQKPPKLNGIKNALVQVKFTRGSSEPFRVKSLVDLGADAAQNGATKVLLDGEIPAWGQWSKTPKGEKLFEITETQLLPGVDPPGQDPLPGYQVQLTAAAGKPESFVNKHQTALIGAAVGAGVLALAAVGLIIGRRRRGAD